LVELWDLDSARIAVIGEAASPFFGPPEEDENPRALIRSRLPMIRGAYVLAVSGPDVYKNTEILFDAWERLAASVRRDHQLSWSARFRRRRVERGSTTPNSGVSGPTRSCSPASWKTRSCGRSTGRQSCSFSRRAT